MTHSLSWMSPTIHRRSTPIGINKQWTNDYTAQGQKQQQRQKSTSRTFISASLRLAEGVGMFAKRDGLYPPPPPHPHPTPIQKQNKKQFGFSPPFPQTKK